VARRWRSPRAPRFSGSASWPWCSGARLNCLQTKLIQSLKFRTNDLLISKRGLYYRCRKKPTNRPGGNPERKRKGKVKTYVGSNGGKITITSEGGVTVESDYPQYCPVGQVANMNFIRHCGFRLVKTSKPYFVGPLSDGRGNRINGGAR